MRKLLDLHNMYVLLKPVQGLNIMIREFEAFVKKTGLDAVRNLQGDNIPQQFVDSVLQAGFFKDRIFFGSYNF